MMTLTIPRPDYGSRLWADLPVEHRIEIEALIAAIREAPERGNGLASWFVQKAPSLGISPSSLRAKYYALAKSGDWRVLVDARKATPAELDTAGTRQRTFRAYLLTLVESYQRKNRPAFRELRRRWRVRDQIIPGYEGWPGWPATPEGWSDRNLADIVKAETNKARMRSIRVGTSSKTNPFLPTVLTTRVGLWPGAVIQLDDVWHDNYVSHGKNREIVRALELGALDLLSGHRFHWGAKPRRQRQDRSWETIAASDMRLFLAGMLHRFGFCPQGMQFMSEHATAKVEESVAASLYNATHGLVRVEYQPIEGRQAALAGYWSGTEGGNFRAKACLESTHALIHNDLAALAMQTGSPSSGLKGPVTTERQLAYIRRVLKKVQEHVPHRLDLLRLPVLDFHSQFIPFLTDYYHFGLALRTDHDLEGWEALGHVVNEYTISPGSGHYIGEDEFLRLPAESQSIITHAARSQPDVWTRRRKLSPLEVWDRRPAWQPVPSVVLCDIVGQDLRREVTCRRGFIEFSDQDISADPLIFEGRFLNGPRARQLLAHGEKVSLVVFPFDPSANAIAVDAKGRPLGELPLYKRVGVVNPGAFQTTAPYDSRPDIRSADLIRAAGQKAAAIADIVEPLRIHHAETVQDARDLREHNRQIADPRHPVSPDEIAAHRTAAGVKAADTRRAGRVAQVAAGIDTDGALDAWSTPEPIAEVSQPDAPDSFAPFDPFADS